MMVREGGVGGSFGNLNEAGSVKNVTGKSLD